MRINYIIVLLYNTTNKNVTYKLPLVKRKKKEKIMNTKIYFLTLIKLLFVLFSSDAFKNVKRLPYQNGVTQFRDFNSLSVFNRLNVDQPKQVCLLLNCITCANNFFLIIGYGD